MQESGAVVWSDRQLSNKLSRWLYAFFVLETPL